MSFPSLLFDEMIRDLGEMVSLRDRALRRPEIATSAPVTEALQALQDAVSAVGQVAQVGDRDREVADARRALRHARHLFGEVSRLLATAPIRQTAMRRVRSRNGVRGIPSSPPRHAAVTSFVDPGDDG